MNITDLINLTFSLFLISGFICIIITFIIMPIYYVISFSWELIIPIKNKVCDIRQKIINKKNKKEHKIRQEPGIRTALEELEYQRELFYNETKEFEKRRINLNLEYIKLNNEKENIQNLIKDFESKKMELENDRYNLNLEYAKFNKEKELFNEYKKLNESNKYNDIFKLEENSQYKSIDDIFMDI
ncbi:MAG: hypothetical protein R3Y64_03785 [Peptostreptococcaceae bacterium]